MPEDSATNNTPEKPEVTVGDSFLLFYQLPYNFEKDLPLSIVSNVYLQDTPQQQLDRACPQLAGFVLPGYGLPGSGINNSSLWSSASTASRYQPRDLFFLSVSALRLTAPIGISIAGQFELGNDQTPIRNPALYNLSSPWQPVPDAFYSPEDIRVTSRTAGRMLDVIESNYGRVKSALLLFSQVSVGHSKSLQMAYLALFACLEALFVPRGNKARTLAARTHAFLKGFETPMPLDEWLRDEYESGRNKLAHGIQDVVPWTGLRESRSKAFGRLHEIVRLSLLGWLSLDNHCLGIHTAASGRTLQDFLDDLKAPTGQLLDQQKMWCD